jgi:DNA ligase D-like protein (predicted ligase)
VPLQSPTRRRVARRVTDRLREAAQRRCRLNPEPNSITICGVPGTGRVAPSFIEPMTAKVVQALPEGDEWSYEVKFDGYRALLIKDGDRIQIRSRNNNDLTRTYPGVAAAASRLRAGSAVLDGEIVAVDSEGQPSFQALQHRGAHPGVTVMFYAFDLMHIDGEDLTREPLLARQDRLRQVVERSGILLSWSLPGTAAQVIDAVRKLGLEGIIAKRKDSRYQPEVRTQAWVKLKLDRQQEFVIGGYRPGTHGIDALLVGFYEGRELRFAAKVRAGFTSHLRREVFGKLKPFHSSRCPFVDLPSSTTSHWGGGVTPEEMGEMQWVKPTLVAQIRFVEWTADDHLRHSAFLGLRDDKAPKDVGREP